MKKGLCYMLSAFLGGGIGAVAIAPPGLADTANVIVTRLT